MSQINTLGPVGFNPTGEYDNTHKYERLDVVYYEGSSYVALQESIGQLPTNTEYWDCIAVGYLKQNTYDSVAEMKADDTLKDGMYAQTVGYYEANDGGSALYRIREITNDDVVDEMFIIALENSEELIAELIICDKVNILQLGAKKDKSEDIGNIVNSLINKGINTFIPDGEYIIENTININEDYYNLTCNGKLYIDDVIAINITSSSCNIDINNEIIGNTNGTGIKIGSNNDLVAHNNIDIDRIDNVSIGIHITPDNNHGVQYNKFNFSYINANKCIYFNPGDHSIPWINENTFTGGRLRGYYGIITEKGASQTDRFNGNKFLNIGFEGIYYGIKLDFAMNNIFDNIRMAERANYLVYWIDCASNSYANIFNILSNVETPYINDLSNVTTPNIYNAPFFIDQQGVYFGNKLYIKNNIRICPNSGYFNGLNDYFFAYNYNGTVNKHIYTNQLTINVGGDDIDNTHDVILPAELFSFGCGFNKFYIKVIYKPYNATLAIKDTNNNTIIDASKLGTGTITNKFYEIFRIGSSSSTRWQIKEITIL